MNQNRRGGGGAPREDRHRGKMAWGKGQGHQNSPLPDEIRQSNLQYSVQNDCSDRYNDPRIGGYRSKQYPSDWDRDTDHTKDSGSRASRDHYEGPREFKSRGSVLGNYRENGSSEWGALNRGGNRGHNRSTGGRWSDESSTGSNNSFYTSSYKSRPPGANSGNYAGRDGRYNNRNGYRDQYEDSNRTPRNTYRRDENQKEEEEDRFQEHRGSYGRMTDSAPDRQKESKSEPQSSRETPKSANKKDQGGGKKRGRLTEIASSLINNGNEQITPVSATPEHHKQSQRKTRPTDNHERQEPLFQNLEMSVENEYSKGSNNDRQREVKQGKGSSLFKDCLLAIAPSDQTRKQSGRIDGANYHDDRLERDYESDGNDGSRQKSSMKMNGFNSDSDGEVVGLNNSPKAEDMLLGVPGFTDADMEKETEDEEEKEEDDDLLQLLNSSKDVVTSHLTCLTPTVADSDRFLQACDAQNKAANNRYPPMMPPPPVQCDNDTEFPPPTLSIKPPKKKTDANGRESPTEFDPMGCCGAKFKDDVQTPSNDSDSQKQERRSSRTPVLGDAPEENPAATGDSPQSVVAKFEKLKMSQSSSSEKRAANRRNQLQSSGKGILDTPSSGGGSGGGGGRKGKKFTKAPVEFTNMLFKSKGDLLTEGISSYTQSDSEDEVESWGRKFKEKFSLEKTTGEKFVDSHCHIDFLLKRHNMRKDSKWSEYNRRHFAYVPESFEGLVAVFCEPYAFREFQTYHHLLSEPGVNCVAAFGIHPHSAQHYNDDIEQRLIKALQHERCTALGEIGLDYSERASGASEAVQQRVFRRQLNLALKTGKNLVLHCRDADRDLNRILQEEMPRDWVMHRHCFTENVSLLEELLKTFPNMYIGFTNLICLGSAYEPREAARRVPLNRLLLETDAPYFLHPNVPKRVQYAHPSMAIYVAEKVASLKGIHISEVLRHARHNTHTVYNL